MKIKKEVVFRSVAGENMLIPVGETVGEYNGIFSMTEVGAVIWQSIENGQNESRLQSELQKNMKLTKRQPKPTLGNLLTSFVLSVLLKDNQKGPVLLRIGPLV